MSFRRGITVAVMLVVAIAAGAQFASASNPATLLGGCMKSWTPYKVPHGTDTILTAHSSNSGCYAGAFQNCLERSSWQGYVKLHCNSWHPTSQVHDEKVSGCLRGKYDYHTFQDYITPSEAEYWLFSEAYKAFVCRVTV